MMDDLHFDDFVNKQLSTHTADVPAHVLENVIAARKKSDPKTFWMWFTGKNLLIASLLVIVSVGGYLFVIQSNAGDKIENNNASKNTPIAEKINTISTKKVKGVENKIEDKTILKNQDKNNEYQKPGTVLNEKTSGSKISSIKTLSSGKKNITQVTPSQFINEERENKNNPLAKNPDQSQNTNTNNLPTTDNSYLNHVSFPITFLNNKELSGSKKLNQKFNFPSCPTIEKDAAGNKTYYEVYAGPDYAIGNYKAAVADSATNTYLQKRKEATKTSSAFSAGIRYTKVFDNGMSARTGLNYSQINEKFKYINPNEIKLVTVITTRIVVRSPGDTLFLKDTLQYQQTGTRIKTTYNHYRNIDIPLVLGYELGNGRLHANINAGIIINVYSWYKGDVLDTSYQPVSITTGKNSPYQFKNNIGVGFLGGVSVYYKLTGNLHLLLEPYFRYNLSPMSKENLNLQQKYSTAGIRAGLRFDLK